MATKKRKAPKGAQRARRLIPWTGELMSRSMVPMVLVMAKHGLIELENDPKTTADQAMEVLRAQGAMTEDGEGVLFGRCIALPVRGATVSLLAATPILADEYGPDLQRRPSPVRFERTRRDEIRIPVRWFLSKLEELASNPATSEVLRPFLLSVSRRTRSPVPEIVLPAHVETVAVTVQDRDGTETVFEALPPGCVLSVDFEPAERRDG